MHPARVVLRLREECSARGVVTHGAHYALLARRRLERSAASLSGVCQRVSNLPTCVERPTIGVRSSPRVSGEDRRRGGEEEKKGGGRTLHCGERETRRHRGRQSPIPRPRIAEAALPPNMSSQAKVKKDKEIIAEYETQVKGW